MDDKTVKGSYDREGGIKALQLVIAWASEHRVVAPRNRGVLRRLDLNLLR